MKSVITPLTCFVALLALWTIRGAAGGEIDAFTEKREVWLDRLAVGYFAAWYVADDCRKRLRHWPSDLVVALPFILFPIYVISTRGWRGVAVLAALLLSFGMAAILSALLA